MHKIRNLATSVKFWLGFAALFFASLVALGATIDRPAWKSELVPVAALAESNAESIGPVGALAQSNAQKIAPVAILAAKNAEKVLQINIDIVQRQVWAQEDRLKVNFTQDGNTRLRELREQLSRLIDQMKSKKAGQ